MSKLERFLGKPKKVVIGGEELELKPLTVRDLDVILNLGEPDKRNSAMVEIISRTLRRSIKDATDEEIEEMGLQHFKDLMDAIMEVNELEIDKKKMKE